jgi:antitoxin HigA-1
MRFHTHPGEILREEFMIPLGLSANALSRDIDVPPNRITSIIAAERAVTPDTALRLARYFDTTPEFWLNLQMAHDLSVAVASTAPRSTSGFGPGRPDGPPRAATISTHRVRAALPGQPFCCFAALGVGRICGLISLSDQLPVAHGPSSRVRSRR